MPERVIAVYMLTNEWHTVLYTGVTADLEKRLAEHRAGVHPNGFSKRYRLHKLVYYETTSDIRAAIAREKQIKAGSRRRKIELIEAANPGWKDLSEAQG